MADRIFKDEVYAIIGAAMDVYNNLRPGFAEPVYQECLEIESTARKLPYVAQMEIPIFYKGQHIRKTYIADFVFFNQIIVEIKALDKLTSREEAQLLNYLKATNIPLGLLINFGAQNDLKWKRMVANDQTVYRITQSRRHIREE